ncbi:hypothetical protein ONE63_006742 [Megalurothrips usitatus]|uniref:Immunoglobulin-like beta-sandwich domain-containing protein n=1 Tax=Megalurothrips usitatus TaxID=439358 RepID=A0AAV7XW88_9NEOP|nr:hypothetical protein ONE63_006742 [Megalurothrips usitatus]
MPVTHNLTQGVILSSRSLVLQRVTRRQAGGYTCHASNERGNTTSRPVHLRVKCEYTHLFFFFFLSSFFFFFFLQPT